MTIKTEIASAASMLAAAVSIAACGGSDSAGQQSTEAAATTETVVQPAASGDPPGADLPQGSEHVELDPAEFTTSIDNPYWPMAPGNKWVYSETDTEGASEKVVVEVLDRTKLIANGIEARVIRDTATEGGVPLEITDDWFAQDSVGNIWYLGEHVTNYENGKPVDHDGSFEAGVDGAEAGVVMPADPQAGMEYRQEYYAGEAEDNGAVVTVGEEQVQVPFGFYDEDVLMTRDLNPGEPKTEELKFYAPDVGPLLSIHTDGAGGRATLVSYEPGK